MPPKIWTGLLWAAGLGFAIPAPGRAIQAPTEYHIDSTVTERQFQALIDTAATPAVIHLGPGSYPVTNYYGLQFAGLSNLTIRGDGLGRTTIHLAESAAVGFHVLSDVTGLEITNLSIVGASQPCSQGDVKSAGIEMRKGSQGIRRVRINNLDISYVDIGVLVGAGPGASASDVQVTDNHIHDICGTRAGAGYGIQNVMGGRVTIARNVIHNVHRHSIYQTLGTGPVLIADNFILDHGRYSAEADDRHVALVVARSSNTTVLNNVIVNSYEFAMSFEPKDDPGVQQEEHNVHFIGNRILGTHTSDIWVVGWGNDNYRWGNQITHRRGPSQATIRVSSNGLLEAAPQWESLRDVQIVRDTMYAIRGTALVQILPSIGSHPTTWWSRVLHSRWRSGISAIAARGDRFLYVAKESSIYRIDTPSGDVGVSQPIFPNVQAMAALGEHLYVIQNRRLHLMHPDDFTFELVSETIWEDPTGLVSAGGSLYAVQDACVYAIDPETLRRSGHDCSNLP